MRRYNKLITALVLTFGISALFTACGSDAGKEPVAETVTEAPKEIVDSELYDSFMNNEAKVLYRGTNGIKTVFANLATALEEGQAYTIKQIVFLLQTKSGVPDKIEPEIKSERIDCGGDGVQELMVDMTFGGTGLYMVIKDIDGELNLCFAEDYSVSGENVIGKTEVKLNPDGTVSRTIEAKGNNGYEEYSVIDGSGEFHRYYAMEKKGSFFSDYTVHQHGEDIKVSASGLDGDHIIIYDYELEDDDHYITYSIVDDMKNDITKDEDFSDSNEVKKRFEESGIKVYTPKEIDELLANRAKEIGYPTN